MSKDWPSRFLGEICTIEGGNAAPQDPSCFEGGTIPFVRMRDLGRGHFTSNLVQTDDRLTATAAKVLRLKMFEPGCLLFPRSGSVFLNHRAILGVRAAVVSHIGVLTNISKDVDHRYLYYYLTTYDMTSLSKKTTGVDSIAFSDVSHIRVPLPPLADQRRIVALLDAANELRRLRVEADRRTADLVPAVFHEMFGDLTAHAPDAKTVELEEICTRVTDGTHQPPAFSVEGVPFLFVANIMKGTIDFETDKHITEETYAELTKRVRPERGDVLYSTVGSYGVAVLVETDRKFAFQRHIAHIKPNHTIIDAGFLCAQLNTPFVKAQADERARGIAQKTLNLSEIRRYKLLLPPLEAQRRFSSQVLDTSVIKDLQAQSRRCLDDLFKSLLHRAFQG